MRRWKSNLRKAKGSRGSKAYRSWRWPRHRMFYWIAG